MTLHLYFAKKFLITVFATLAIISTVAYLIDLVEHSRKYSDYLNLNGVLRLTLLNTPKIVYEVIDLIILIASISFFSSMSKSTSR